MKITLRGEEMLLLPERAMFWEERRTLFVSDIHLGRSQTFRSRGNYLPDGQDADDLKRLEELCGKYGVSDLWILGDLIHAPVGMTPETSERLAVFLEDLKKLNTRTHLIRGNHDRRIRFGMDRLLEVYSAHHPLGPFVLSHEPMEEAAKYGICGHLHPGVRIQDVNGTGIKAKCFWITERFAVLPAFGTTTASLRIQQRREDTVVMVNEGSLVKLQGVLER